MFTRTFDRLPFTVFTVDTGGGTGGAGQDPAPSDKPQEGDPNGGTGSPDNPAAAPEAADDKGPAKRLAATIKNWLDNLKELVVLNCPAAV